MNRLSGFNLSSGRVSLMAVTTFLAMASAQPALAQDDADDPDEREAGNSEMTIIVTARKQEESLLEVPVAASALGGETLDRYAINDVTDLGSRIAAVSFDNTSNGGGGSLTIRGVGSSTLDTGIEGAVATVVDGIQTSRGNFIQVGLLDLDQVEVLKGPQALFFGKNSPGGVLSLSSAMPTDYLSGNLRAGYEFYAEEIEVEGALSGPLTDTLRGRIAFRLADSQGWLQNVAQPTPDPFGSGATLTAAYDANDSQTLMGRATLEFEPSPDFSAVIRLAGVDSENRGSGADTEISYCGGGTNVGDTLGVPDPAADCRINFRNSVGGLPPTLVGADSVFGDEIFGSFEGYLASLTMNLTAGAVDITSVTGYLDYTSQRQLTTGTVYAYPFTPQDESFSQFSQEIRAVTDFDGPLNFAAGIYYESTDLTFRVPNTLFPSGPDSRNGSFLTYEFLSGTEGESFSVFGQIRWNITEELELDVGGRYSRDERSGFAENHFVNDSTFALIPLVPEGVRFEQSRNFNNFSPEVTLSWEPNPSSLIYASYRTGYKAGSTAQPAILPITFNATTGLFYEPEEIEGFELGFKTLLADDTLRLLGSVFSYDYTDLQISNFNSTTFLIEALNVGELRTRGAELELLYQPIDGMTINGAIAYTDAEYQSFPGIACYAGQTTGCVAGLQDLSGQQKFRSPEWTGNAGIAYEQAAFNDSVVLGANAAMRFSSSYFTQENNSIFAVQDSFAVFDAGISVSPMDSGFTISLIGRNLGNEKYATSSLDMPNSVLNPTIRSVVGRGRQIWLQAKFEF